MMGLDFVYSETEWAAVAAELRELPPCTDVPSVRQALQQAASTFSAMSRLPDYYAEEREEVLKLHDHLSAAAVVAQHLEQYGYRMHAPIVDLVNKIDKRLPTVQGVVHLRSGNSDAARELLYRSILLIWYDLGKGLTYSPSGPLVRFIKAAAGPILGDKCATGAGIRDIVRREHKHRKEHPKRWRSNLHGISGIQP